jgi:hypothetical protein
MGRYFVSLVRLKLWLNANQLSPRVILNFQNLKLKRHLNVKGMYTLEVGNSEIERTTTHIILYYMTNLRSL